MDGTLSFLYKKQVQREVMKMEFLNFVLAVSPIIVVLAGILILKKPAMKKHSE